LSTEALYHAVVYDIKTFIRCVHQHTKEYNIDTSKIAVPGFSDGREDYIKKLNEYNIYIEIKSFEEVPHSFCLFDHWFLPAARCIDDFSKKIFTEK